MHELSIAQALVEQVEAVREANGGGRVVSVDIRVGRWQHVVPEILAGYFEHLTRDTPLEAARVEIEHVEVTARCKECARVYAVDDIYFVCPDCGSRASVVLSGKELNLVGVELDD